MARTLPATLIAAMNAQSSDVLVLALFTITHSGIPTLRFVNNTEAVVFGGNVYTAFPFSVILPPDEEDKAPTIQIEISNVGLELIASARVIAGNRERALGTIQIIESGALVPDVAVQTFSDYDIVNVSYTHETMTLSLAIESFLNEPYPAPSYTPANFPGLF